MKTDSTSWSQLSAQIEKYRQKAKINLQKYERNRFNNAYKKKKQKSQQQIKQQSQAQNLGYSLNLIRSWQNQQEVKTSRIVNKISYLKVQRDRKMQSTQRAKNKLQRVLSIRSSTSQQKFQFQNEIRNQSIRDYQNKKIITERVKSEKARIDNERNKILSQNSFKAKVVRQQSINNQETIQKQKYSQLIKNQKIKQNVKQQIQNCLQKKRQRQKNLIQEGKMNHTNKIRQQYLKFAQKKKMNQKILKYFMDQSKKIMEETEKAHRNLMNFESSLYMRKKSIQANYPNLKNSSTPHTNYTKEHSVQKIPQKQKSIKKLNNFFCLTTN